MNMGMLGPQFAQMLGSISKGAGGMGFGAPPASGGAPGGAPGLPAQAIAPGGKPAAPTNPFTMPKGGLMGILGGGVLPQGLLGMLRDKMNQPGQPQAIAAPGMPTPSPTPVGGAMPQIPQVPFGPIY